jgi:hypothetical protein
MLFMHKSDLIAIDFDALDIKARWDISRKADAPK